MVDRDQRAVSLSPSYREKERDLLCVSLQVPVYRGVAISSLWIVSLLFLCWLKKKQQKEIQLKAFAKIVVGSLRCFFETRPAGSDTEKTATPLAGRSENSGLRAFKVNKVFSFRYKKCDTLFFHESSLTLL